MRKAYPICAALLFGLALIFALGGYHLGFPELLDLPGRATRDPEDSRYALGFVRGIGLICTAILCAIAGNTLVNILIRFRRA